ncbi:MAG TPA: TIGR00730 family Rossman fold protein [Actinomycetota bacterium]
MEAQETERAEGALWIRRDDDRERSLDFMREELRAGFEVIDRIDRPAVTVFGSARLPTDDPWYERARRLGRGLASEGFAVVTGGGPGLMEAANRGAQEAGGLSIGFGIELPMEQRLNPWLDLSYEFHHFYARKVCFVKAAEAFVVLPGGWGTNDELFEALTLLQTGKIRHFPVMLVGSDHWRPFLDWGERLAREGMIATADLELVTVTDDPNAAVGSVTACIRGECGHMIGS